MMLDLVGREVEVSTPRIDLDVAKFISDNYTVETQHACHKALSLLLELGYQSPESAILSVISQNDTDPSAVCVAVLDILQTEVLAQVRLLGVHVDLTSYTPRLNEAVKLYKTLTLVYEAYENVEYADQLRHIAALAEDSDEFLGHALVFFAGNSLYEISQHIRTHTFKMVENTPEEPDSILSSDQARMLEALRAYYTEQKYTCRVFEYIKENMFAMPMAHAAYHKFLPHEFTTIDPQVSPLQTALHLLSVAALSSDGYSNVLKAIVELGVLKDKDLKVRRELEQQIARFNGFRAVYEQT